MKKCDYIRDLILTDYMDREADKNLCDVVESHLMDCVPCRSFFNEVKRKLQPLSRQAVQPVPDELWSAVRQRIEEENRPSPAARWLEALQGLLVFPRLVPVFFSLVLMFLAGSAAFNTIQIRKAQDREQGEYLVSLLSPGEQSTDTEANNPIEHYFL